MKISARYEVVGLLGQGGMGVVYHVRDTTRGRENALKTLAPGRSEDIVERFLTEAQVMFRLEHDNIVRVYDFGKDGETYFLTMELIRGKNLRQLLNARQNKGFPLAEVIRMGIETADALNYAHSQKPEAVVHRDIKPVNIMIEEQTGRVVVTDFGIAKLMADTGGDAQAASDLSRTVFAGTVPYSAPEQFQPAGARRLDARVDIYALGIVLFEIYTGRHFFAGLSAEEVESHHRAIDGGQCPVKSAHACDHKVVLPDTPESFIRVIEKAIARDRNERYRTAGEMLADLQACAATASIEACAHARVAAEAAGAPDIAPTEFRRGSELEEQAKAAQAQGDHGKAGDLYREAMQAFTAATAQAAERHLRKSLQEAKAAMQAVAREATDQDTAALAPDEMRHAAQLVATADANEAQGQLEQAAGLYRQAEAAFRVALAAGRKASVRRTLEGELPAIRAARERAEEADAATLAPNAFTSAVESQRTLEAALDAGELTRVRELLPQVRDAFANAEAEATRRLQQSVEEARTAMRAVAAEATAAGAPTNAKAAFIEAETLASAAEKLVERGELELAIGQLGRAAEAYRAAVGAAGRAAERLVLEKELPAIRAARADAEQAEASALAADAFAAATAAEAELEAALAAGELTRVRELLPKVGAGFTAAKSAAATARASRATADARAAMVAVRDAAVAAGAEQHTPDALKKARAREQEAAAAEQRQDWKRAEQLYGAAAKAFEDVRTTALRRGEEERLASSLAQARRAMEEARARAKDAGAADSAPERWGEAVALAKKAADAANDVAGMTAATADYAHATERFETAAAEAELVTRRRDLEAKLAAVDEARAQALKAGASRDPDFNAADDARAAAQRALAAGELSLVVSSATTAHEHFKAAKTAAERAKADAAAGAVLVDVAARAAEAGEAGAETLANAPWSHGVERQKQALARRHEGDPDAVMPLAAEALQSFTTALVEAAAAAQRNAGAARAAAELAGPDDTQTGNADKSFATAEQRRGEGQLVAAAVAYRKATAGYEAATKTRADAARKTESDARNARAEADDGDAATHAKDEYTRAVAQLDAATKASAGGRFREAETAFEEAQKAFRAAVQTAARERKRTASLAARKGADDARGRATAAGAAEHAANELKRANDTYAGAVRAFESENFAGSESDFNKARDAFERAREAAVTAALEREVAAARTAAEQLRATRVGAATGFFAKRKLAKVDTVVARATAAAASRDFAAAKAAFDEAVQLFEAMPAAEPAKPTPAPAPPPQKPAPAAKPPAKTKKQEAKPAEAAPLDDGVTVVATPPERASDVTVVAGSPAQSLAHDVTIAKRPPEIAARTGRAIPAEAPNRTVPIAIGAVVVLLLLAGAWLLLREKPSDIDKPPTATAAPKVTAKPERTAEPARTAVASPVAPPVPSPARTETAKAPTIDSFSPTETNVVPAGATQQFRITLAEPAGATYTWSVDGKPLADATSSSVTIPVTDKPQRVVVIARVAGAEARHEWDLAALPPAEAKTPVVSTVAPVLTPDPPSRDPVLVQPGRSRRFAVKATRDGDAPLRYAWTVEGKPAGTNSPSFELQTEAADEGASRRVRVEVTAGGPASTAEWTVTIPLAPVTITRQSPTTDAVSNEVDDTTNFSVDARAGKSGTDGLTYTWTVNRRPVDADGPRYSYRADREGTAEIEVRVEAPERQAAIQRWTVRTRAVPLPTEVRTAAPVPPRATSTPARPPVSGDPRRELEAWIASYRDAYEQKNVDRLVALGVVKSENATRLAAALKDLTDLKVSISGSSIEVQGPDSAVVSLTRQDTFMAGGRSQTQSINIKKTLRKVGNAWVAQ